MIRETLAMWIKWNRGTSYTTQYLWGIHTIDRSNRQELRTDWGFRILHDGFKEVNVKCGIFRDPVKISVEEMIILPIRIKWLFDENCRKATENNNLVRITCLQNGISYKPKEFPRIGVRPCRKEQLAWFVEMMEQKKCTEMYPDNIRVFYKGVSAWRKGYEPWGSFSINIQLIHIPLICTIGWLTYQTSHPNCKILYSLPQFKFFFLIPIWK